MPPLANWISSWFFTKARLAKFPTKQSSITSRVTYLNRLAGLSKLSTRDGGTVLVRSVAPEDENFLLALYASTRAAELDQAQWQEGQREQFVKWQFDMQRKEYDSRFPDAEYAVILIDEQRAGRIWIGEDEKQIRLLDIAILPQFQNRGLGTLLLQQLIREARAAKKPLRHMVFVLNDQAHRFYERLGFVIIEDLGAYKHMEWKI